MQRLAWRADAPPRRALRRCVWVVTTVAVTVVLSTIAAFSLVVMAAPQVSEVTIPQANVSMTISAVPVQRIDWPMSIEAAGNVEPWQETVIGAQTSGLRLLELRVNVGDKVTRGQVLARFDAETLHVEEAQLRATLAQADAASAQAEANRQRALQLETSGGISRQEILQYVTQALTAHAQVDAVRAQIAAKHLQLRYATVLAPDDGVISARSATVGSVAANGQELMRLIRQSRLEWRGELRPAQLVQIKVGQHIDLALPNGDTAKAQVRKLAPTFDPRTRLGLLYADIDPKARARAGMYASGRIALGHKPALVVPAVSVVIRDGRSYVFALAPNQDTSAVTLNAVVIGRRRGADVEIVSGLDESASVAAQGAGLLNDGDRVRIEKVATDHVPITSSGGSASTS